MQKIISVLALLIICIFFLSMHYVKGHGELQSQEELLVKAFDASGADTVSSEIYFWAKTDNIKERDVLQNIAYDLSDALTEYESDIIFSDIKQSSMKDTIELNGECSKEQCSSNARNGISIKMTLKDAGSEGGSIYGSVVSIRSHKGVEETRGMLDMILEKYGIEANINTSISGEYEGRLSDEQMDNISGIVLKTADAQRVEGLRDGNTLSVSAYSPFIPGAIKSGNKKINVNVAMRYSPYVGKTLIWLATPVILKEY